MRELPRALTVAYEHMHMDMDHGPGHVQICSSEGQRGALSLSRRWRPTARVLEGVAAIRAHFRKGLGEVSVLQKPLERVGLEARPLERVGLKVRMGIHEWLE